MTQSPVIEQGRFFSKQLLIRTDVYTAMQSGFAAYEFIKKYGPTAWTQLCAQVQLEIRQEQSQLETATDGDH